MYPWQMDGWMFDDGWMAVWWIDGCIEGWMDGFLVDGWMDVW